MNKTSIRNLAFAAALALSLGATGIANAQGPMMGGMPMLSPEQQATVQKLNTEFFSATTSLRQQIMSKQAELNAQVNSTTPDTAKIETISKDLGALQGKLLVERAALNAKLTKEGLPAAGHGMMGGMEMGGMMGGMMEGKGGMMGGKGCMEMMKDMGAMQHGAGGMGGAAPSDAATSAGQHNQPGHQ